MWKNIKDKWNALFEEDNGKEQAEEKVKEEKLSDTSIHKTVETKMSYRYPKNKPMNLQTEPKRTTRPRHSSARQVNVADHASEQRKHFDSETAGRGFEVSHVPSPIHGFRKPTIATTQWNDKPNKQKTKNSDMGHTKREETLPKVMKKKEEKEEVKHRQAEHKPSLSMKEDQQNVSQHSHQSTDTQKEKQAPNQQKSRSSSKPFNVIMTPRDKKRNMEKYSHMEKKPMQHRIKREVPIQLLDDDVKQEKQNIEWMEQQKELLQVTLNYFHIKATVVDATQGPSVTRFEVQPEPGVKVSKIKNLSDDIKLNLKARDIRMEAPIPGKNTIGIEVPNLVSEPVVLQNMLIGDHFKQQASPLTVALGSDIEGNAIVTDLKKMPHGLIAGATGSGKSVCINTILISLLYKASHEEVKFLLIDPKMVELTPYNQIPHLVSPVITDVKAATSALKWAVSEMEDRYEKFVEAGARDIERYNQKMERQGDNESKLPYMVIVIDELADLMMTSPQDVEDAICRIAQKARACGIHLIIATQRPSVDVITGLIKANIPTRIAFSVSSQVDSRTILDTNGAEKLLGKGDMLFIENGSADSKRIQGAFVSDDEIERVTSFVKKIAPPNYLFEQEHLIQQVESDLATDDLYNEAVAFVMEHNGASASLLQRRFKIGYNRAARLIDTMEQHGIISGQNGSKQREVLLSSSELENYLQG
ncbi:DNA translocase FtsK [Gracilibacillus sp. YIM 98692]|uniref:DNA translocase FtsK n=1 Tax=Gracilibacillus sp. YIM 98692 TaxID=2663532 RepID=UPI0013CF7F89|nr:DNA translocase FtsK [Gracilibacillus sp. YIM 98692]